MSFGSYDSVSLAEAREKRDTARKQVANGIILVEERGQNLLRNYQLKTLLRPLAENGMQQKQTAGQLPIAKKSLGRLNMVPPFNCKRPISEIKPLELLEVLSE